MSDDVRTVGSVLARLAAAGYDDQFTCVTGGLLSRRKGVLVAPGELQVEAEERFEGPTDPADETLVLALARRDGALRGTLVVAYGPGSSPLQAEVLSRLGRRHGAAAG